MGEKELVFLAGICFAFIGIILTINSFSGITGFAVLDNFNPKPSSILGAVFILIGIALVFARHALIWHNE